MADAKKVAVDFEEIIKADRQRRQNERLAQEIFSKGRRASGPGAAQGPRKPGSGPSLASRVGVVKRSASYNVSSPIVTKQIQPKRTKPVGNVDADWTHDLHELNSPAPAPARSQFNKRPMRGNNGDREVRLYKALNGSTLSPALNSQFNIVGKAKQSGGFSIRGLAGPSTVLAENFAPGTTAADIESAMAPIGGTILKCSVITSNSMVIAELVFESREGADKVIDQFHDQTADDRILRLYHKPSPVPAKASNIRAEAVAATPPLGPRADIMGDRSEKARTSTRYGASDRYEPRERSGDRRRDYERDDVMDGSYGFEEPMDTDEPENSRNDMGKGGGLYSDSLVNRRGGRGSGGRVYQDARDGGRGGNRGRDRGRGYR